MKIARILAALGHEGEVPLPDVSTKSAAQAYIGLDMVNLNSQKAEFLKAVVPGWIEEANKRESEWPQYEKGKKMNFSPKAE